VVAVGGGDVVVAVQARQADGRAADGCHDAGRVPDPDQGLVFLAGDVADPASRSGSPAPSASARSGVSPALGSKFGSSNTARVRAGLCNNCTYRVSSRTGPMERQILTSIVQAV
jgi:hypothetical protein